MPEIYRNGIRYGGGTQLPQGGAEGQTLKKRSASDWDVEWADLGGAIFSYIVGSTPFASDWLSETPSGSALTPKEKQIYLVLTSGDYYNNFLRWDSTESAYLLVSSGGSGKVVEGYYNSSDHKFYEEDTYTTEITGERDIIYVSVDSSMPYWYDGTNFNAFSAEISDETMSEIDSEIDAVDLSVPTLVEYTDDELFELIWEDLDIEPKPEYTEADLDAILDQIDFSGGGGGGGGVEMSAAEMLAIWNTVFGS